MYHFYYALARHQLAARTHSHKPATNMFTTFRDVISDVIRS